MSASYYMHAEIRDGDKWKVLPAPERDGEDKFWNKKWIATTSSNAFAALCVNYRRYGRFELIAPLRGLPADTTPEVMKAAWNGDDDWCYNPTWYTLKELLAFDWDKAVLMDNEALVASEYVGLQDEGKLLETNAEMEAFIAHVGRDKIKRDTYVANSPSIKVPHKDTYRRQCFNLMQDLDELSKMGNPEDIRIIVWWNG